jgi:hypothetical protein
MNFILSFSFEWDCAVIRALVKDDERTGAISTSPEKTFLRLLLGPNNLSDGQFANHKLIDLESLHLCVADAQFTDGEGSDCNGANRQGPDRDWGGEGWREDARAGDRRGRNFNRHEMKSTCDAQDALH